MCEEQLRGKWALVTGASSGLGMDFSRGLAARGCTLIFTARREERMEELKDGVVGKHGVEVLILPMDLARDDAARELMAMIKARGKQVDILINNAGFGLHGAFLDVEWERYQAMIKLNVQTVIHLTKLALPGMVERGFGYILFVASNGAFQPSPQYALYGATKSLVRDFSEALNYELRDTPVSCTVTAPGATRTEFHDVAGQEREENFFIRTTLMESERVTEISLQALFKGKPSVVPGLVNRIFAWTAQRGPRRLITALAGRLMGE